MAGGDIATIGFRAESGELRGAKSDMEALVPSAGKATRASQRLAKMFESVDASANKLMAAANALTTASEKLSTAIGAASAATNNNDKAMKLAAASAAKEATALLSAANANQKKARESAAAEAAAKKQAAASLAAAAAAEKEAAAQAAAAAAAGKRTSVPSIGGANTLRNNPAIQPWGAAQNGGFTDTPIRALDDLEKKSAQTSGAVKANVGNIAAQFQDIGVTAAMGMNPLIIALQQGTQLSAVFGQTGGGALAQIRAAFTSIISPVSLLTIAITALAVVGIQWLIDLATKGSEANLTLKEQNELIQSIADRFGEAAPRLQAYADALTQIKDVSDALKAGDIAAKAQFEGLEVALGRVNDKFERMMLVLSGNPKNIEVTDKLTQAFANLNEKLREGKATNEDLATAQDAVSEAAKTGAPEVAAFGAAFAGIVGQINSAIGAMVAARGEIGNLTAAANKALNDPRTWRGAGKEDQFFNADTAIAGGTATDDLLLPLVGPNIVRRPSDLETAANRGYVKPSGGGGKTQAENFESVTKAAQRQIETLKAQAATLGMSEEAAAKLKYETDLLNDAQQKNIKLTPDQKNELTALAGEMATLEVQTKRATEALEFAKDATKGFVSDLVSGLEEGKSVWESFTNAALNLSKKLIDRGLNAIIDKLFEINTTASQTKTGGGGGLFGGILGIVGKLFGGGAGAFPTAPGGLYANGGVFGNGINAHSNSVVSRPTLFAFASGAGIMGEAGPEAVMPLKRGPDGSLGVQMHDGGRTTQQPANNSVQIDNHYTIAGAISSKDIAEQIQSTAEKTKEETKQSIMGWLGEYDRNGIMGTN